MDLFVYTIYVFFCTELFESNGRKILSVRIDRKIVEIGMYFMLMFIFCIISYVSFIS